MNAARKKQRDSDSTHVPAHEEQASRNFVQEYLELIRAEFSSSKKQYPEADFVNAAVDSVLETIDAIVSSNNIHSSYKKQVIDRIFEHLSRRTSLFSADVMPNMRWSNREKDEYHMHPCEFVKKYYPTYGEGLIQSDIRSNDLSLYNALHNRKKKEGGWPTWFVLPSKREYYDAVVQSFEGTPELKGLEALPPSERAKKRRAYEAAYRRRGPRNKKN